MGITIGNYAFEGSFTDTTSLKAQSGVYAILGRNNQVGNPTVVDIGESENIRNRVENHDRKDCWTRQGYSTLTVAAYYCDAASRVRIESELRRQYNPPCGVR